MAALDRTSARDFITLLHRTCDCLRRLPAPVIARFRLANMIAAGEGPVLA